MPPGDRRLHGKRERRTQNHFLYLQLAPFLRQNCREHTAGDHCDICATGHYGDPMLPNSFCRPCQCPTAEKNFARTCSVSPSSGRFNCQVTQDTLSLNKGSRAPQTCGDKGEKMSKEDPVYYLMMPCSTSSVERGTRGRPATAVRGATTAIRWERGPGSAFPAPATHSGV